MLLPAFTGSGESVLLMLRTGADDTVVVIAAPAVGAVSLLSMLYVPLVMTVPFASGLVTATTSCTLADAPAARAPMFQVTTPAASVPPPVADTKLVFAGMVSVITTPVALAFPLFAYLLLDALPISASTGSGASVLLMVSVGADATVVVIAAPAVGAVSLL